MQYSYNNKVAAKTAPSQQRPSNSRSTSSPSNPQIASATSYPASTVEKPHPPIPRHRTVQRTCPVTCSTRAASPPIDMPINTAWAVSALQRSTLTARSTRPTTTRCPSSAPNSPCSMARRSGWPALTGSPESPVVSAAIRTASSRRLRRAAVGPMTRR